MQKPAPGAGRPYHTIALKASQPPLQPEIPAGRQLRDGTLLRKVWSGKPTWIVRGTISTGQIPARQGRVWLVVKAASAASQGEGLGAASPDGRAVRQRWLVAPDRHTMLRLTPV